MCVQLDLFTRDSVSGVIDPLTESEFNEMLKHNDLEGVLPKCDPCRKCRYIGMCDADECAMKGFKLDSQVRPKGYSYKYGF